MNAIEHSWKFLYIVDEDPIDILHTSMGLGDETLRLAAEPIKILFKQKIDLPGALVVQNLPHQRALTASTCTEHKKLFESNG